MAEKRIWKKKKLETKGKIDLRKSEKFGNL